MQNNDNIEPQTNIDTSDMICSNEENELQDIGADLQALINLYDKDILQYDYSKSFIQSCISLFPGNVEPLTPVLELITPELLIEVMRKFVNVYSLNYPYDKRIKHLSNAILEME